MEIQIHIIVSITHETQLSHFKHLSVDLTMTYNTRKLSIICVVEKTLLQNFLEKRRRKRNLKTTYNWRKVYLKQGNVSSTHYCSLHTLTIEKPLTTHISVNTQLNIYNIELYN